MNKINFFLIFFFINFNIIAQSTSKEITDIFFEKYSKDPDKAMEYAFSTNKYFDVKSDGAINLRNQLKNAIALIGNYNGFESIVEKKIGQSLEVKAFIAKYDRLPIRFSFLFYKPADKWIIQNITFDTDIDKEWNDVVKINNIQK